MSKQRDLIAQSQSGTGKTAFFSIGILNMVDPSIRQTQALVLSPTHELAQQIQKVMYILGNYMSLDIHCCIGGQSMGEDIRKLDYGVQIVSGTPGRVYGSLNFYKQKNFLADLNLRHDPPQASPNTKHKGFGAR